MEKNKENWIDFREWQVQQELQNSQMKTWSENYIAGIDPYRTDMFPNVEKLWEVLRNNE